MEHDLRELIPIRRFAEEVGVSVNTITMEWQRTGQAPELIRISNRLYLTEAAWNAWEDRRARDRIRLGKPHMRAPEAPTPRVRRKHTR